MNYDPLKLCTKVDDHYEVDPAVMFPATIERIRACVVKEPPTEIVSKGWPGRPDREPVADRFLRQAEAFTDEDWKLGTPARAAVLDFAESWFKRALALKVGPPVRIHISRDPEYRR